VPRGTLRWNAELSAQCVEWTLCVGPEIEALAQIDRATRTAGERRHDALYVEVTRARFRHGRELQPEMELQHAEDQEREPVLANEARLKCGLADLTRGIGAVAGQQVPDVVEQRALGHRPALAGQRKTVQREVLPERAPERSRWIARELRVTHGERAVFATTCE